MIAIIITLAIIVLLAYACCHAQPLHDDTEEMMYIEEWRENHGQR